jgi:hypothetical protein
VRFIKELRAKGFKVVTFDGYHHRVNDEFDFWLNDHGQPLAWRDRTTGDKGRKPPSQMAAFITQRLVDRPTEVDKETFIARLVEIGWKEEEATKQWNARNSTAKS